MADSSSFAIPLAILGGSALIAIALYAGLRSRETSTSTDETSNVSVRSPRSGQSTETSTGPAGTLVTSTPTSTGTPTPQPSLPDRSIAQAAIANALEQKRALFRTKCWDPAVAKSPTPKESTYVFEIGVDEKGHEYARGISDTEGARPDVGECLRYLVSPVSIPAPGQQVTARTTFKLP